MKNFVKQFAIAGALMLAFSGSQLWAITVVNGGFEDPGFVTGWNIVDGGDMVLIAGSTPYGNQHLEIGGFGGATQNSIDQVIGGFTPSLTYRLEFSIASQWANQNGASGAEVEVSFPAGSSTPSQTFLAPPVPNWASWVTYTYDFVATSALVDLQFMQITNGFDDVGIDNISITGVPEPSTLVLGGLGALGLAFAALRKKHRRS